MALAEPKPFVGGMLLFLQQAQPRGTGSPGGGRQVAGPGGAVGGQGLAPGPLAGGPWDARPPSTSGAAAASGPPRVYVTGLVEGVDEEMLNAYFVQFGLVKDVYIPTDKVTGQRKPFAFVTMSSLEDTSAILAVSTHYIGENLSVNVTAAAPRGSDPRGSAGGAAGFGFGGGIAAPAGPLFDGRGAGALAGYSGEAWGHQGGQVDAPKQGVPGVWRLFVWGMPVGLNADMLRGHFARHGELLDIYVPAKTPDLAYITFSQQVELQDALVNSGLRIAGYTVQGLKVAEPRETGKGGGAGGRGGKGGARPWPY